MSSKKLPIVAPPAAETDSKRNEYDPVVGIIYVME